MAVHNAACFVCLLPCLVRKSCNCFDGRKIVDLSCSCITTVMSLSKTEPSLLKEDCSENRADITNN